MMNCEETRDRLQATIDRAAQDLRTTKGRGSRRKALEILNRAAGQIDFAYEIGAISQHDRACQYAKMDGAKLEFALESGVVKGSPASL